MPKKCSHCKGNGMVTPTITMDCPFCRNIPEETKHCPECDHTGRVRREVCEICEMCGGTGKV